MQIKEYELNVIFQFFHVFACCCMATC